MGNDGGSIPTRRELVKNAARDPNTTEVKAIQLESQTHAWTYCPLSQRPLAPPIVSDCAGILYNKDAMLEYLLPGDEPQISQTKTEQEATLAARIKSIRDIVEVRFRTEKDDSVKGEKFICPITSKELGPHTKAIYLVPCGHAFSEAAIKQIAGDACLQCSQPYDPENIINILPISKEEISRSAERMQRLREAGLTHSLKKYPGGKKKKRLAPAEIVDAANNLVGNDSSKNLSVDKIKKRAAETARLSDNDGTSLSLSRSGTATPSGGIKNTATASLTAKVLDEQEENNKRRKLGLNSNLKSLFSKGESNGIAYKGGDFMTRGYSIPKRA